LRLPKADPFSAPIIFDEFNSSVFKRAANGGFIWECDRDVAVDHLGPTDCSYAYL
jgi:hypothetical protein